MTVTYTSSSDVLRLTGGTSGSNLTPANIVSDVTAYSAASTYAVGTIVKQDNSDGIGISVWKCTTAITVAEAWTYAKWARIVWVANKTMRLDVILDIGAFYNDTGWQYETTKMIRTAAGVAWTSGSVDSTSQLVGFKINHSGSYTGTGWSIFNAGGSTDFVNWTRCEIYKASTNRVDIALSNSSLPVTIRNLTIDGKTGFGDNHTMALSAASDVDGINFYYCNLAITPNTNLKNIGHLGLYIESPQNKIGVVTAGAILKNYAPSLPTDLSRLVGLVSAAANQYLQDMTVPTGFLLSTVQAYYATTSAYFTRTVAFVLKQGTSLLGSVYVYGYKTGSQSTQVYAGTSTAGTGVYTAVAQVFYGNRSATAGGSYVALQNTINWTDQTVLFRRLDLEEASYQQDMNVSGITLTQFMATDAYNTVAVPATVAAYPVTIASSAITVTAAASLHNLYDYAKYWLTQNMTIATFLNPFGTTLDMGSYALSGLQYLTAASKFATVKTTGSITAAGAFTVSVVGDVSQAVPTDLSGVTITGNLTYNTNSAVTVTLTDTTITGTVSNSGTGAITITLNGSTIGTVGAGITTRLYSSITITGIQSGSQVAVYDGTGAQQDYVASSGTSYTLVTTGGTGSWTWKVRCYGLQDQSNTFTPSTGVATTTAKILTDTWVVDSLAAVMAYTDLNTLQKVYDYSRYFATTATGIALSTLFTKGLATLSCSLPYTLDPAASALLAVSGGVVTTLTSGFSESGTLTVSGDFTQGSATLSVGVLIRAANLDSELVFSGIDSLTVYATQSDAFTDTSPGATSTSGIIRFLYGASLSGVTMSGTVYIRTILGTVVEVQALVLAAGANLLSLSTTVLLQSLQASLTDIKGTGFVADKHSLVNIKADTSLTALIPILLTK